MNQENVENLNVANRLQLVKSLREAMTNTVHPFLSTVNSDLYTDHPLYRKLTRYTLPAYTLAPVDNR